MHNSSSFLLFFTLLVSIVSCHPQQEVNNDDATKVLPYAERYTYLTDTAETKWLAEPFAKFWQPTDAQKKIMENLAIGHIAAHSTPDQTKLRNEPFARYYRQYMAYVSQEGDSIMNINAECWLWRYDDPKWELDSTTYLTGIREWKEKSTVTDDGGDCFWTMEINYSKRNVITFSVNALL